MTVVALASAKGSPGVTTTALGLANLWTVAHPTRRVLLAEVDPAGGDIGAGYLRGESQAGRGLLALAAQRGHDPVAALWSQLLSLDDLQRTLLLLGLSDPTRSAALDGAWTALAQAIDLLRSDEPDLDVLLDCGRLEARHDPRVLRQRADRIVVLTGSSASAAVSARAAARRLSEESSAQVALVVVGPDRPYSAQDVAEVTQLPLLGALAFDPATASVWSQGVRPGRRLMRSPLARQVRALAASLAVSPADDVVGSPVRVP
jgi:Mrp family chromosome partitioning ATPase